MESSTPDLFSLVKQAPIDPTFGFKEVYANDPNHNKIFLCLGVYSDNDGKHYDFNVMKKVEHEVLSDASLNKAYLPFSGDP